MGVSRPAVLELTDPNYYTEPPVSEMKFDPCGECWIEDFVIGHRMYGKASFLGRTNVARLDLDSIGREMLYLFL